MRANQSFVRTEISGFVFSPFLCVFVLMLIIKKINLKRKQKHQVPVSLKAFQQSTMCVCVRLLQDFGQMRYSMSIFFCSLIFTES